MRADLWARVAGRVRYPLLLALVTVGGLAAVLLLFVLMERDRLGTYTLDRPPEPPPDPGRRPVAGVVDVHLRRRLSEAQAALYVESWAEFVRGVGADVRPLSVSDEEGIAGLDAVDVVVVPSPVGLDGPERRSLEGALAAGRSLLVAVGGDMTADEGLAFQAPFWRRLLDGGAPRVHTFARATSLTVARDVPFRHDLPRGAGLRFEPGARALLEDRALAGDGDAVAGPADLDLLPVRWGRMGEGRWVFFGFDPAAVPPSSRDRATVSTLLGGAFSWLGRAPAAEVLPWPEGRTSALTVRVTSDGRPLPTALLDLLAERNVAWTLTYAPRAAAGAAPADLPGRADLATRGDGARSPRGLPRAEQARIVAAAVATARRAWPDREPRGYAPPGERVDEHTLAVLAEAGLDFVFAQVGPPVLQPDVYWSPRGAWGVLAPQPLLVSVPRTVDDELGYALRTGEADPVALARARRADLERVVAAGGLYTLDLDGAALERPGALDALRELLDEARAHDPWVANASELARWWRRRAHVVSSVEAARPHRVVLRLSNVGDEPVDGLAVRLQLPGPAGRVSVELSHWRRTLGTDHRVHHTPGDDELVIVAHLPPGANEVLHIEWP